MGLIHGVYDGKEGGGFEPGGCSIHNCMSGHGPDAATVEKAANAELAPTYLQDTLAFMFESRFVLRPTLYAQKKHPALDATYWKTWQGLASLFKIS
jgi:homogentisate 1,2-dioxygenase